MALTTASCGSDSSGGSPSPEPIPDPDPIQTVSTLSAIKIIGEVNAASTSAATTASAHATTSAVNLSLVGTKISAKVYGDLTDDEPDQGVHLLNTAYTTTNDLGSYSLPLTASATELSYIELTFEKDGYIVGEKVLRNFSNDITEVEMNVRLAKVEITTHSKSDGLAFTASGEKSFRFGLVRRQDGSVAAVAGSASIAAAAAGDSLIDLELPVTSVGNDVSAVTAKMAYFDSSSADDIEAFPGEFVGQGSPDGVSGNRSVDLSASASATTSADEDNSFRLVSTSFSQVDLVDQNGDVITLQDSSPTASSHTLATMYLRIGSGSYKTITKDADTSADGVQIPVYVYRSGSWQYVGNGTLVTYGTPVTPGTTGYYDYRYDGDSDSAVDIPPTTTGVSNNDYDGDGTPDSNGTLYARIDIDSGNEWIQWINLDWPIQPTVPVDVCFNATVRYEGNDQEKYDGYLSVSLPDGGWNRSYVSGGVLNTTFSLFDDTSNSADNWSFRFWNRRVAENEEFKPSDLGLTSISTGSDNCNQLEDIVLKNPNQYRLQGFVTQNSNPKPGRSIYVSSGNFWDWAVTNNDGFYSLSVPSTELNIEVWGSENTKTALVNGVIDGNENSDPADDGELVQVDIALENLKPIIAGVLSPDRLLLKNGTAFFDFVATAYDDDSDSISFDWSCAPVSTCSFSNVATASAYVSESKRFTATATGTYTWQVTASDTEGKESDIKDGIIIIEAENKSPRIIAVTADNNILGCSRLGSGQNCSDQQRSGEAVAYSVLAYDPDGDQLTYNWIGCNQSNGATCSRTITEGAQILNVSASDPDSASDSANIAVNGLANSAPVIEFAYTNPTYVMHDGTGNKIAINLQTKASDDFTAPASLTYNWQISGPNGFSTNAAGSAATIPMQTLPDKGRYGVILTVTDGDGASSRRNLNIVVDNRPPKIISAAANPVDSLSDDSSNTQAFMLSVQAQDKEGEVMSYSWSSGTWSATTANATIPVGTLGIGNHAVDLTVTDASGNASSRAVSISVLDNLPPSIDSLIVNPLQVPSEGEPGSRLNSVEVNLSATASDREGDTINYGWTISGNDWSANGPTATIPASTLAASNTYTVTLSVHDGINTPVTNTETFTVVENNPPADLTIVIDPLESNSDGLTNSNAFILTGSAIDSDSTTLTYSWMVQGTSLIYSGTIATIPVNQSELPPGQYTVELTVEDEVNSVSTTGTFSVAENQPPTNLEISIIPPVASNDGLTNSEIINLVGRATDNDSTNLTYSWSVLGTALSYSGASATIPVGALVPNTYTVRLTVADVVNSSSVESRFRVNALPEILAPDSLSISIGSSAQVTLQGVSVIDDSQLTTVEWTISGVSGTFIGIQPIIDANLLSDGDYMATITVTDSDGGISTTEIPLIVSEDATFIEVQ